MDRHEIDALIRESGLDPRELLDAADLLETVGTAPDLAPHPSAALARMLAVAPRIPGQRRRRSAAIIGGGAVAVALAFSSAAAANLLPRPVQDFLHDITDGRLPVEFPAPPTMTRDVQTPSTGPRATLAPRTIAPPSPTTPGAPSFRPDTTAPTDRPALPQPQPAEPGQDHAADVPAGAPPAPVDGGAPASGEAQAPDAREDRSPGELPSGPSPKPLIAPASMGSDGQAPSTTDDGRAIWPPAP